MNARRNTLVLGAIACAMAAYIVFVDRGTLSTGELEARRGRVIETFVRAHVTRIEITQGEHHVVLQRDEEQGEEVLENFGVGDWSLEAPVHAPADGEAVDGLMSTLEWLDARRTLEGISDSDRHQFGLDEPQASVRFTVAGTEHELRVGHEDARGEGLYVTIADGDTAWIVGRDLLEALQHDADHFRNKDLFRHFRARDARRIEVTNADTHAVVEREDSGPWSLSEPVEAFARTAGVDSLTGFAVHARATRFLTEEAGPDLAAPTRELRIERAPAERGATGDEADRSPWRLRVIGACPDHADELVAVVNDGPVVCILASDVEPLDITLAQLREMRLVTTADDRVDTITIARGSSSFTLRRADEGWRITIGTDDGEGQAADEDAVGELMRGLRGQEAQEFVPADEAALSAHGMGSPAAVITITRTDDGEPEVVTFGASDAVGAWARRGDEAQLGRYDLAARALLDATPIAFRARHLADRDPDDATEVRITRGTATEVATHADDGWHLSEPAALVADEASVRDVTRAIGGLEAVRFVAEARTTAHELDHPRYTATVHFAEASSHDEDEHDHHDDDEEHDADAAAAGDVTVHVGAATEGGAFASLGDDPAVFVVTQALVDALAHPLASRDLLAVPTGDIASLRITGPNGVVALREQGDGWVTDLGPAASGPATAMLDRLASLHASGVEPYGTAMPAAVITIEATKRSDGSVVRIEIGPVAAGSEASPYRLARITGVPVVFRLPDEAATAFADYRP